MDLTVLGERVTLVDSEGRSGANKQGMDIARSIVVVSWFRLDAILFDVFAQESLVGAVVKNVP